MSDSAAGRQGTIDSPATGSGPTYRLAGASVVLPATDGDRRILTDITFDVTPGEIVGIVGKSGTGKTTLLRVLGGLVGISSGTAQLQGRPIDGPDGRAVTVFQDYANALLPWRTVERNVGLPLERTVPAAERRERIAEALALVGLSDYAREHPWRLSGGMQQRVQIARALAMRPRVLLMDEPFGALDALTRANLQDEVLRVHSRTQATIVFITHDIEEAAYLSDRVFVISGTPGTIVDEVVCALPRPRGQLTTRELPEYLEIRRRLGVALGAGGAP
ncbi:MAG TPA: ABC transporter ATP-binding protein [Amycolatopsis sp.]|uniref:ABC transporter ATP-binding protein n=1 Tax=Amycolatopsis sp. TaxID=37632 RepID=UPI002B486529|nr:ABC transporter ATP-binding protein [Amycolatopsis sp.]HJQ48783.1 ABC transporter ATP-binding protein [Amycolatopsis sp.]HKS50215.1 ABC transporter ATP-binding protein [Amycolatopsis sp.]